MTSPLPPDESTRLESLRRHHILDTPPEPSFDRITRLAARLLHAPLAFVSLIDRDRQWFKSSQGEALGAIELSELPRDGAFCAQAILSDQVLVVPDAALDARFITNPFFVAEPHLRFYAGAPLIDSEGFRLGTLAVMDTAPRQLSADEEETLRELAGAVSELLEERRLNHQARQEVEERDREIERAHREWQSVEERLRLLESVVVTANDAILITEAEPIDLPGPRILYVNPAFTRMTGYTLDDMLGQTPRMMQGADTDRAACAKIRAALKKWQAVQVEVLNYRKDGTPFWVELSIVPVANESGWYTHWVSIQRETSPRREAEAEIRQGQERYARIAANTPGMVYQFVLHPDGSVDWPFVSEGCRTLYGVEPSFAQANPNLLLDGIPPEDRAAFHESIAHSARTLEPWRWEGRFTHSSGEERWGQAAARPERLPNGDVLWDGVTLDITARKQAEAALQQAKEEAESAQAGAEQANCAKSEFLSRMSHELRTPLNAILGFGQLLEPETLNPDDRDSVNQILRAGRHLLQLINEVLDISRIEAGRLSLSLEPVGVREMVREVLDLAAPLAAERRVALRHTVTDASAYVLADYQRLKQVLLNLVSNAVKYNRVGGHVTIDCRQVLAADAAGGGLSIEVSDTGGGIASQDIGRLFTPFERLGAESSGIEGTGIGLALSKRLAEMMGGQIGVRSAVGRGSTFFIELPSTADPCALELPQSADAEDAGFEERAGRAAHTVLYIEDNGPNLRLIERILARRGGARLLGAMQGGLGLELAREQKPDLILLDLHLPDMPGEEVLRQLREDTATREIPIIVLSADATPKQIQRLLGAGAQDYLTKPLDVKQFGRVLEEHLPASLVLA